MRFARLLMLLAAAGAVHAQTWDTSGNSMLSGAYYFRQLYYVLGDNYGDLSEAVTLYGTITFDGNGNYSITGAEALDSSQGYGSFTTTGRYSIGAGGYGFITSPYVTGDYVYGVVSANGVFIGSTTDTTYGYNDMLVAAPLASPAPTISSFTGTWIGAVLDMTGGSPDYELSYVFTINPNGNGALNVVSINGYVGSSTQLYTQTGTSGLTYTFSNGAAVATFPSNGELMSGQKYFYFSKDGNFMFGGSPVTSKTPFDFIVAVKTTSTNTLSGLYYQAGVDSNSSTADLDSYFGSFNVIAGAAPQTYLGHQRVNDYGGSSVYDYTYNNTITISGSGYSNGATRFIVGAGGTEMITSGITPYLGISVALQAPTPAGTGVYINPTGVVNAASNAPFTAGIAPGELLTLYGSNLAPSTAVAGIPFPTTGLNGVQVTIGGYPAAIYYVSATQISAIVPYEVTVGEIVDIQVNNNGAQSNIVTNYVANTAPGVFTQNQNGTGYGEIEHLGIGNTTATPGSVVTDANPAIEGETLAGYLTGLGAVSPAITDGAPGPTSLSEATNTITFDINDPSTQLTPSFAGLAPSYSGLYQFNFTLPTSGITVGPNYFDITGPDAYMSYLLLPIQATAPAAVTASEASPETGMLARFRRPAQTLPTLRNKAAKRPFSEVKKK
jgi:uncharacterized protein (TIGR03437 family)